MKNTSKRIISFILAVLLFLSYPLSAYASDDHPWQGGLGLQLYYNLDEVKQYIKDTFGFWVYAAHQTGAIVKADFEQFANNYDKYEEVIGDNNVGLYKDDSGTIKGVYLSKEFMTQLKTLLDDYAAENQPFKVEKTYKMSEIPASSFRHKVAYDYFKSYFDSDSYKYIVFRAYSDSGAILDITSEIKEGGGFVNSSTSYVSIYDSDWRTHYFPANTYTVKIDENNKSYLEFGTAERGFQTFCHYLEGRTNFGANSSIATKDGGNIRVYNTVSDFINYSVGQRKIYYTNNYYNYTPKDLQVSIDDLQKTIDDMQDVIDKLLDQITNDTSESEIEELFRQILEELKNNQGGNSGGEGSGGSSDGDVNVDIDLGSTNNLLSKILAKVTQIFDKISQTAENAGDTVHAKLQETLDEILVQIKKLKHWTMADTAVNAADAVADWLDFIKDLFSGADDAAESAVGAISSVMDDGANLMKTKFPFCIPWDVYLLVGFLAEEPQTPNFRLPIVLDRYGIEEYIEVDLENFTVISRLSRTLLTCMYCYALLNLTMKVFPITKEGGD